MTIKITDGAHFVEEFLKGYPTLLHAVKEGNPYLMSDNEFLRWRSFTAKTYNRLIKNGNDFNAKDFARALNNVMYNLYYVRMTAPEEVRTNMNYSEELIRLTMLDNRIGCVNASEY